MDTSRCRIATVRRAQIVVITIRSHRPHTLTSRAFVYRGACVAVIAVGGVIGISTPNPVCTVVGGAGVAIPAIQRRSNTNPRRTFVVDRTRGSIIAGGIVVGVDTTQGGAATVGCA